MGAKPRSAAKPTVYQYPKCGTCRNAIKWMTGRGIEHDSIDITLAPPSKAELKDLWKRSGLPLSKWFNTSGQSYRNGGFKDKLETMSDDQALAALAADGKLIKRPVVVTTSAVLVGFDDKAYQKALG